MTPTTLQEPVIPPSPEWSSSDEATALSEDIAAALGEGALYLRLDSAAVWLVD